MDFLVIPITPGPPRGRWPAAWTDGPTYRRAAPSHSGGKPGMAPLFPWQLVDRGFAPARYDGFNPRGRGLPHTTPCGRSVLGPEAVWRRSAPASRHRGSDAFSGRRVGGC